MTADIDALCEQIIAAHRDLYHPGFECAENEHGECLDPGGGTPTDGPFGERRPVGALFWWPPRRDLNG